MSFTVTAPIETIPPSHHDKAPDRQTRDLVATAETYEEARDMVRAQGVRDQAAGDGQAVLELVLAHRHGVRADYVPAEVGVPVTTQGAREPVVGGYFPSHERIVMRVTPRSSAIACSDG